MELSIEFQWYRKIPTDYFHKMSQDTVYNRRRKYFITILQGITHIKSICDNNKYNHYHYWGFVQ